MAEIKQILSLMRRLFPEENRCKMDFDDNVGLLVGSDKGTTDTVLCCLDVTNEVISEAAELGAKLIISHHPVIFLPIKKVTDESITGNNLINLIKNGISVYSAHTNMDFGKGGLNHYAADLLGLKNKKPLDPYISPDLGLGIVGELEIGLTAAQTLKMAKEAFKDDFAALYALSPDQKIKKVAVINGGSADIPYIEAAIKAGADCLISGDVKHHVALYAAQKNFALIEIQHYLSESVYSPVLAENLNKEAKLNGLKFTAIHSKKERNPRIL